MRFLSFGSPFAIQPINLFSRKTQIRFNRLFLSTRGISVDQISNQSHERRLSVLRNRGLALHKVDTSFNFQIKAREVMLFQTLAESAKLFSVRKDFRLS